ncbi:hypothetical protein [Halorhabdus amylolytica]|uniref:hypothetical protein n=1 Tax=Halorhabdus amylolytica TaxID=2559573 RepID=UPI00145C05B9|nr:hypothetical protein [Halorhabdus amylolytica]
MIDSEDYAPNDPEVQEREDVLEAMTTVTSTPTETETETETATETETETATPTQTPEANTLSVDDEDWQDTSRIESYSSRSVSVTIDPDHPETDYDEAKVYAALHEFPKGAVIDETFTDRFDRTEQPSLTLTINADFIDIDQKYYYIVALCPADIDTDDPDFEKVTAVMQTDPFEFEDDEVTIERTEYDGSLDDDSGENYTRNEVEGAYKLELSGRTRGQQWTFNFFAYKDAHAAASQRSRGRSRPEYVSYELTEGTGGEIASLLKDEADKLGFEEFEAIEFVVDFVQSLPYVTDDVSTGYDDYTKFIIETLTEMEGDCEDTAIMLASILEAEPFNYDMVLIQPPGHMAAGIWNSEPSGWYWELDGRKYSYIETTGEGWGVGDCPENYQSVQATLYQV